MTLIHIYRLYTGNALGLAERFDQSKDAISFCGFAVCQFIIINKLTVEQKQNNKDRKKEKKKRQYENLRGRQKSRNFLPATNMFCL